MATGDLMIALFGAYEPTGVYSFEFRKLNGDTIAEVFFLLPPETVTVEEPQRSALIPTLKGGYLVDFGQDFKEIKVGGSSHFYYAGSTKNPAKEYGSSFNIGVPGFIDGYTEFIKLRFMISRYRDYTLTPDAKLIAPPFGTQELARVNNLKSFVKRAIDNGEGALADNMEVIWHDYDYDDHFKVRVSRLVITRDKADPWTIRYDIAMQGYEVDTRKAGKIKLKQPNRQKKTPTQLLRDVNTLIGEEHSYSIPETVSIESPGTSYEVSNIASNKQEDIPTTVDLGV